MATVSNPKRNPANAEVSDQKEMRAFMTEDVRAHFTINARCATCNYEPGELERLPLTVYKRLGRKTPDASVGLGLSARNKADFDLPQQPANIDL